MKARSVQHGAIFFGPARQSSRLRGSGRLILSILLCGALTLSLRFRLERLDRLATPQFHSFYVPSGTYVRLASLGFRSLLADILYIWSIQYYSNEEREQRFKYLRRFYALITDLDPKFVNGYIIGALILGMEASDLEGAVALLEKGMKENPDNWYLPFEAGYYCYKDLNDLPRSLKYFRRAKEIPDAPDIVKRWYGHLLTTTGSLEDSLELWQGIYEEATDEHARRIALRKYYEVKIEWDLRYINASIDRYRQERGRCPKSLMELFTSGATGGKAIPVAPSGKPYSLNLRQCKAYYEVEYLEHR